VRRRDRPVARAAVRRPGARLRVPRGGAVRDQPRRGTRRGRRPEGEWATLHPIRIGGQWIEGGFSGAGVLAGGEAHLDVTLRWHAPGSAPAVRPQAQAQAKTEAGPAATSRGERSHTP
jgi:hypothetical protein